MALTRKFLSAMGVDEDKLEEIITAHLDTVNGLKEERDQYKADAEKLHAVQKELDDLKSAHEGEDKDPYKVKYEAMKEEFETLKADIEAKETASKKSEAVKAMLKEIGVADKRIDAVLRVTDLDGIEFDDKGNVKDADKIKETWKTDWSDFIVKEEKKGVQVEGKQAGGAKGTYASKAEIMAIPDRKERRQAMAENPQLFPQLKSQED